MRLGSITSLCPSDSFLAPGNGGEGELNISASREFNGWLPVPGCWPGFWLEERGLSSPFLLSVKEDRALARRRNLVWKVLRSG